MNEYIEFSLLCTAAIFFLIGWIIGRKCAYKNISQTYAKEMEKIKARIADVEHEFEAAHNLEIERANLEADRKSQQQQNEQIRKRVVDKAKADALAELQRQHRKFPYM